MNAVDAVISAMDSPRFIVVIESCGRCDVCGGSGFCRVNRDNGRAGVWHHACREHIGTVVSVMVESQP